MPRGVLRDEFVYDTQAADADDVILAHTSNPICLQKQEGHDLPIAAPTLTVRVDYSSF